MNERERIDALKVWCSCTCARAGILIHRVCKTQNQCVTNNTPNFSTERPAVTEICKGMLSAYSATFLWWFTHLYFGLGMSPITPPGPAMVLTRARQGGGGYFLSPSGFSAVTPEVKYGSSPNFQYPPCHQFHTSWQKENSLALLRRP